MSLGEELAAFLGGLIESAAAAPEAERARIRTELEAALERLGGIAPNAPRIHELAERRRAELADESLRRRQDEPTSKVELPPPAPATATARLGVTSDRDALDRTIDPATGMQRQYLVLSAEERARGFERPVRRTYVHVGTGGPKGPTRPLTDDERERYAAFNYVLFEEYPASEFPKTGRYWTNAELARATGCGTKTTMGLDLAETYARQPTFYSGTFCVHCRAHFPIGEAGEFVWDVPGEPRVGT